MESAGFVAWRSVVPSLPWVELMSVDSVVESARVQLQVG